MLRWLVVMLCVTLLVAASSSLYWYSELSQLDYRLEAQTAATSIVGAAALTLGYLLLRWFRWHFFLRRFTRSLPAMNSFQVYFATLPMLLTPFNVGELVRVAFLSSSLAGCSNDSPAWNVHWNDRDSATTALTSWRPSSKRRYLAAWYECTMSNPSHPPAGRPRGSVRERS